MTTGKTQAPVIEVQVGEVTPIEPLSDEFALPALKDLEVPHMNLTQEQETRFGCRLVQQRPLLDRLILPELSFIKLDALVHAEWVCLNLIELRISLDVPNRSTMATSLLLSFHRQIGKLTKLEILHFEWLEMETFTEEDSMALRGAVNLTSLTLVNCLDFWTQQDIVHLLRAAPKLVFLKLDPLGVDERQQVTLLLQNFGKAAVLDE
ncbi:hypothetical protein BGX33_002190 [Mortierella sp. NVP41]|nr:hypothetical protein BGX33_002190 [Mortierella sp. NVP41]